MPAISTHHYAVCYKMLARQVIHVHDIEFLQVIEERLLGCRRKEYNIATV